MTEEEKKAKIVEKIGAEKDGMSFVALLAWASEQAIDFADVIATRLVSAGKLRIDYPQGLYLLV